MRAPMTLAGTSAAAALVMSLLIAAPAAAGGPHGFTCTGTPVSPVVVPSGTYARLTMPPGSGCEVDGPGAVTVRRAIYLGSGAALFVNGGSLTVRGGMTVGRDAVFAADAFTVGNIAPVEIDGPVNVRSRGVFSLGQEDPYGPVFARIRGRVSAFHAALVVIHNTRIDGRVKIRGGGGDNPIVVALLGPGNSYTDFEDDQIHGSLTEIGYKGVWAGIIRSKIWGSLTFAYNVQAVTAEYDIGSNRIFGSAYCAHNNPAPNKGDSAGAPSIVYGRTRGNQAKTCTGVPGGFTGPPV